jgi:transcriptional regulator with XRE-family HTH domain
MANEQSVSDVVAARVREVRGKRGMTVAELAARCAELGVPELTAQALYKLEQRRQGKLRPRPVTVDELLVLALALDIAPVHLLAGLDDQAPYPATPSVSVRAVVARRWMRGWPQSEGLPGYTDQKRYLGTTPDSEDDVEYLTRGEYDRVRHILEPESEGT